MSTYINDGPERAIERMVGDTIPQQLLGTQQAVAEVVEYLNQYDSYMEGRMDQHVTKEEVAAAELKLRDEIYRLTILTRDLDRKQAVELRRIKQIMFSTLILIGVVGLWLVIKSLI